MITDEMVEAATEAFRVASGFERNSWEELSPLTKASYLNEVRSALEIFAPLIAAAEREACAKMAESMIMPDDLNHDEAERDENDAKNVRSKRIAAAIRARGEP